MRPLGVSSPCSLSCNLESCLFSIKFRVHFQSPENEEQHTAKSLKVPLWITNLIRVQSALPVPRRPTCPVFLSPLTGGAHAAAHPVPWPPASAHVLPQRHGHACLWVRGRASRKLEGLFLRNGNWSSWPNILLKRLFLYILLREGSFIHQDVYFVASADSCQLSALALVAALLSAYPGSWEQFWLLPWHPCTQGVSSNPEQMAMEPHHEIASACSGSTINTGVKEKAE